MPQHDQFHAAVPAHRTAPRASARSMSAVRDLLCVLGVALPLWVGVALATWWLL